MSMKSGRFSKTLFQHAFITRYSVWTAWRCHFDHYFHTVVGQPTIKLMTHWKCFPQHNPIWPNVTWNHINTQIHGFWGHSTQWYCYFGIFFALTLDSTNICQTEITNLRIQVPSNENIPGSKIPVGVAANAYADHAFSYFHRHTHLIHVTDLFFWCNFGSDPSCTKLSRREKIAYITMRTMFQ